MSYSVELDIESGIFTFFIEYSVPIYYDPESGEQFGDTSWSVTVVPISGGASGGSTGGYGSDSNSVIVELGLLGQLDLVNYRLDFSAMNMFSGATVTDSWNVLLNSAAIDPVTIAGTSSVDVIVAGHGPDTLQGLAGDDRLYGGDGNDTIEGGQGSDWIDGGRGADTLRGGLNDDIYIVDDAADGIQEASDGGIDTVYSTVSYTLGAYVEGLSLQGAADIVGTGNNGNNYISANGGDTYIYGLEGNDTLVGNSGDDHLYGGAGNDRLEDLGGIDRMEGGVGDDTYKVTASGDTLVEAVGGGDDTVEVYFLPSFTLGANIENLVFLSPGSFTGNGNALNNQLKGGAGADRLDGRAGDDRIEGGDGNDIIYGGAGSDILIGGAGWDTADYSQSQAAVVVNLNLHNDPYHLATGGDAQGDMLQSIEQVVGSAFNDNLTGTFAYGEQLIGGAGDDTINGRWGDDTIKGGAGADYLVGDLGVDTVLYDGSADGVTVDLGGQVAAGGDGTGDTIIGFENVTGSSLNDHLIGDLGANRLRGGDGDDTIEGGKGNDTVEGGQGSDVMDGGEGIDLLDYSSTTTELSINLANLTVFNGDLSQDTFTGFESARGGSANDNIIGDDGANILLGAAGNDVIDGGAGDDTIRGGVGADTLEGGVGLDRLSYSTSTMGVGTVLNGSGYSGDASGDTSSGFENLEGGQAGDVLYGDTLANYIWGLAGDDYIGGSDGNDVLLGGEGNDTLDGGAGAGDTADFRDKALSVSVTLNGSSEVFATIGSEVDTLLNIENAYGGSFADTLIGDAVNNQFRGGGGNDMLDGGSGNDILDGGDGNDVLDGGSGADTMTGGAGDDTYYVDDAGDNVVENLPANGTNDQILSSVSYNLSGRYVETLTLTGAAAINGIGNSLAQTINGNGGANTLQGLQGNDVLNGGGGNDVLDGGDGNDVLDGGGGADKMTGGAGDDYLDGNSGFDAVSGSAGNDQMVFNASASSIDGGANIDTLILKDAAAIDLRAADQASIASVQVSGFENVDASLSAQSATLTGANSNTGNTAIGGGSWLHGGYAADTITAGAAGAAIIGGGLADSLFGSGTNDRFILFEGDFIGAEHISDSSSTDADRLQINGDTDLTTGTVSGIEYLDIGHYDYASDYMVTGNRTLVNDQVVVTLSTSQLLSFKEVGFAADLSGDILNVTLEGGVTANFSGIGITQSGDDMVNLNGTGGGDTIFGFASGWANIYGGGGDDMIRVSSSLGYWDSGYSIQGQSGSDSIEYGRFDNAVSLNGGFGNQGAGGEYDTLVGSYNDAVAGGVTINLGLTNGDQTLGDMVIANNFENVDFTNGGRLVATGSNIANQITGSAFADTIDGGAGADTLNGGAGEDIFRFTSALGAGNTDAIIGYNVADDVIQIDNAVFAGLAAGALAAGAFNTGPSATEADDRIIYNSATGALLFDADGTGAGAAAQFALLPGGLAMSSGEFLVI